MREVRKEIRQTLKTVVAVLFVEVSLYLQKTEEDNTILRALEDLS